MSEFNVLITILSAFAILNVGLNALILYCLRGAHKRLNETMYHHNIFADVYAKMDAAAAENTETMLECMTDRANYIIKRLEHIHRRQNTIANMIKDDRERLRDHVNKVETLHDIAEGLGRKFLNDTAISKDA